jgi:hypothetical protein
MKFTDTQFAEAIELIHASDAKKSRKDKRRAARTEIRVPVSIKLGVDANTDWINAKLRDISARGTKLETSIALEIGSSFLLRLPTNDGKQDPQPLICRVAHCVPQKNSYLIGAEFTGRLTARKSPGDDAADLDRIQRSILD